MKKKKTLTRGTSDSSGETSLEPLLDSGPGGCPSPTMVLSIGLITDLGREKTTPPTAFLLGKPGRCSSTPTSDAYVRRWGISPLIGSCMINPRAVGPRPREEIGLEEAIWTGLRMGRRVVLEAATRLERETTVGLGSVVGPPVLGILGRGSEVEPVGFGLVL
jgi:hypothetical protein